jgi:hypothetical protein
MINAQPITARLYLIGITDSPQVRQELEDSGWRGPDSSMTKNLLLSDAYTITTANNIKSIFGKKSYFCFSVLII